MSLLPILRLIVNRKSLIVFFITFSIPISQFSIKSAYAADPGPPNPQPCKNALGTDKLTDNYITNERGEPPIKKLVSAQRAGVLGESVPVTVTATFLVDFSKLQAIFATPNSNYLEGTFQNEPHRIDSITDLTSQDFNTYHGAGQKAAPKITVDELKKKYVEYVYNKPTLPESTNTYKDIEGQGDPKTVYDLANEFGLPNPPESSADEMWLNTWGRYWERIPTAYREFYKGKLEFRVARNIQEFGKILSGDAPCPPSARNIEFILPEFSRTVSIADSLNKIIVPCAAQSYRHGNTTTDDECGKEPTPLAVDERSDRNNLLAKTVSFCKNLFAKSTSGIAKTLRKALSLTLNLNPVKNAFAAVAPNSCIKILSKGLEGSTPYCALPADQYRPDLGDSCTNPYGADPNKLDKANQNVVCTFVITFTTNLVVNQNPVGAKGPDDFDTCTQVSADRFLCASTFFIWPDFRIPLLSEIWNSTLHSDQKEGSPQQGVGSNQETGRPGVYSFFIPGAIAKTTDPTLESLKTIQEECNSNPSSNGCPDLLSIWAGLGCYPNVPLEIFAECLGYTQKQPAEVPRAGSNDPKDRFMGSVQGCTGKNFVHEKALWPLALQIERGVQNDCPGTGL